MQKQQVQTKLRSFNDLIVAEKMYHIRNRIKQLEEIRCRNYHLIDPLIDKWQLQLEKLKNDRIMEIITGRKVNKETIKIIKEIAPKYEEKLDQVLKNLKNAINRNTSQEISNINFDIKINFKNKLISNQAVFEIKPFSKHKY